MRLLFRGPDRLEQELVLLPVAQADFATEAEGSRWHVDVQRQRRDRSVSDQVQL